MWAFLSTLNIQHDGKEIIAQSTMNRTSTIDSANFVRGRFRKVHTTQNFGQGRRQELVMRTGLSHT